MSARTDNLLAPKAPPKILIVDDAPIVRDLARRWLMAAGYACAEAADAQAAWKYLKRTPVDLVTLDLEMPGRHGIDLLRDIKEAFPLTAVVMMTGVNKADTAIEALTSGASGYLTKPVEREELLFHVKAALERRQLLMEKEQYTLGLEEKVREQTMTIRRAHEETIHRLVAASMYRDEETGSHVKRTGLFSEVLAKTAGWSDADAAQIRLAAPMHDVGKIGVPDAVLRKPGKLTPEEFDVMKTHTTIGAQMLAGSDAPMLQMAHRIALNHHERWDGTGYPAGIAAHRIPESARIVAIVDVYDALTHRRVYRPALSEEEALSIMADGVGTHFDSALSTLFFSRLAEIQEIARQNPDEPSGQRLPAAASAAERLEETALMATHMI
ncbi:MAG: HD domain-containing phosphohydrolase [Planctomycetota bacterium]|jgi:putative two-component system response regulator